MAHLSHNRAITLLRDRTITRLFTYIAVTGPERPVHRLEVEHTDQRPSVGWRFAHAAAQRLPFRYRSFSESAARRRKAIDTISIGDWATSSGNIMLLRMEAPTRLRCAEPARVLTGTPIQRASQVVIVPLYGERVLAHDVNLVIARTVIFNRPRRPYKK